MRVVRKPCVICVTKRMSTSKDFLLSHITSYSIARSTELLAKHMKKSTFENRACDSTAHRAYQTRNRCTETLLCFLYFKKPLPK